MNLPQVNSESLSLKDKTQTKKPPLYKVVLLNDDYTPMEFVVGILTMFFNKTIDEADALTAEIHKNGKGIAGIYPLEIAETKLRQAMKHCGLGTPATRAQILEKLIHVKYIIRDKNKLNELWNAKKAPWKTW